MDDVIGMLPSWMFTAIVAVVVLVIIGIIFASTSIGKAAGDFRSFTSAVRPVLLWSIQTV